jgi:hypothetical protein
VVNWFVPKKIALQFSVEELQALVTLSENQFFRLKYIDPKMPGFKANPEHFRSAQSAVGLLADALRKEKGFEVRPAKIKVASGRV